MAVWPSLSNHPNQSKGLCRQCGASLSLEATENAVRFPWGWGSRRCTSPLLLPSVPMTPTLGPTPDPAGLDNVFGNQLKLEIGPAGGAGEGEFHLILHCPHT